MPLWTNDAMAGDPCFSLTCPSVRRTNGVMLSRPMAYRYREAALWNAMAQAKEAVEMGAMIEVCFLQFQAGPNAPLPFLTQWTQVNAKNVAQGIKEFGARGLLVSSDLGQSANITHPDGLEVAIAAMKREGISDADIDTMMRKNPAKLLGLN